MTIPGSTHILAVNAGSSSIKFALFRAAPALAPVFRGAIDGIGGSHGRFAVSGSAADTFERQVPLAGHAAAVAILVDWLAARLPPPMLDAIAYRVVYGGPDYAAHQAIDMVMLDALHSAASSEPEHLPQEIELIEVLRQHFPGASHVACFDSAFHAAMPAVAATLPIPRRYHALGVKRYGFHGLSCAYLMGELGRIGAPGEAAGKVVIAHLGSGSSVTAVDNGQSRDTTMGLTPAGGIMMGKRSGDLDPGLAWYLARREQLTPAGFNRMVNHQSGLLGISGTSADLRVLLEREGADSRAAEAVEMYCYQVRKAICAMAGAIDGIGTLIFSGGIGEHAAPVRARVCAGLSHLGVALDPAANGVGAALIAAAPSRVCVRVMGTDEQWMIAEEARAVLAAAPACSKEKSHE